MSKKILGFLCNESAQMNALLDPNGYLKDLPNVKIIKVPCSGFVKPHWVGKALQNGADGVFVTGCCMGDCTYREGNRFIDARVVGDRPPYLKKNVDKTRVRTFFYAIPEGEQLINDIKVFIEDLEKNGRRT